MIVRSKEGAIVFAVLAIVILVGAYFTWLSIYKSHDVTMSQSPAAKSFVIDDPTQAYTDIDGNTKDLSTLVGKLVVVTAWASWCVACNDELEKISNLAADPQFSGVTFLAINRAEPRSTAKRYLRTITQVPTVELIIDPSDHFYDSTSGYSMPETVVYDQQGNVIKQFHGEMSLTQLREVLTSSQTQTD